MRFKIESQVYMSGPLWLHSESNILKKKLSAFGCDWHVWVTLRGAWDEKGICILNRRSSECMYRVTAALQACR